MAELLKRCRPDAKIQTEFHKIELMIIQLIYRRNQKCQFHQDNYSGKIVFKRYFLIQTK